MHLTITIHEATLAQMVAIQAVLSATSLEPKVIRVPFQDEPAAAEVPASGTLTGSFPPFNIPSVAEVTPTVKYEDAFAAKIFGGESPAPVPSFPLSNSLAPGYIARPNVPAELPADDATVAPLTPATPASTAGGGTLGAAAELDSKGRPWDARIHGSGKSFLAKTGEWKLARGVDPLYVLQVNAELDAARGASPVNAAPVPQPAPGAYVPPSPTPTAGVEYKDVVAKVTGAIAAKKIDGSQVNAMFTFYGIMSLPDVANHPDKWALLISEVDRLSEV